MERKQYKLHYFLTNIAILFIINNHCNAKSINSNFYFTILNEYSEVNDLKEYCEEKGKENIDYNYTYSKNGNTFLHAAVLSNNSEKVNHILRKNRYLINIKNKDGLTPLDIAVIQNNRVSSNELENIKNNIPNEKSKIIKIFVENGGNFNNTVEINKFGLTMECSVAQACFINCFDIDNNTLKSILLYSNVENLHDHALKIDNKYYNFEDLLSKLQANTLTQKQLNESRPDLVEIHNIQINKFAFVSKLLEDYKQEKIKKEENIANRELMNQFIKLDPEAGIVFNVINQ